MIQNNNRGAQVTDNIAPGITLADAKLDELVNHLKRELPTQSSGIMLKSKIPITKVID